MAKQKTNMNKESAERILRACGYTGGAEQVSKEANVVYEQALAEHCIKSMKINNFDQPRNILNPCSDSFAKRIEVNHPTFDPNDYESIQKSYEQY